MHVLLPSTKSSLLQALQMGKPSAKLPEVPLAQTSVSF
jgi:hypothetical protein